MKATKKPISSAALALLILLFFTGITQAETLPPELVPEAERTLKDVSASHSAWQHRATAGDNLGIGLYERPFTSGDMIYQPDLDIVRVEQSSDELFYFFTVRLFGESTRGGGLQGAYSIEFDRTLSGRGDLLVQVIDPTIEWSEKGITVYGDRDGDVGGDHPGKAENGFLGSGYDMLIELEGDKNAFARIDPDDSSAVQFAVSKALLEDPDEFTWGAWADNGLNNPRWFDYNDLMSPHAAGSPIKGENYPLRGIYSLDNTCRLPVGTGQTGAIPGMCKIAVQPGVGGEKSCYCEITGFTKADCASVGARWICK